MSRLDAALAALSGLGESIPEGARGVAADARAEVARRRARPELVVAVIGEKKAGKSTFLNAVLGERVLGSAAREFTGTVTRIRFAELPDYVAIGGDGAARTFVGPDERASLAAQHALTRAHLEDHEADAAGMEAAVAAAESAVHALELELRASQLTLDHTASALRVAQGWLLAGGNGLGRAETTIQWLEHTIPAWVRDPARWWERLAVRLVGWFWKKELAVLAGLRDSVEEFRMRDQSNHNGMRTASAAEQHARVTHERLRARRDQARLDLTTARVGRAEARVRLAEGERREKLAAVAELSWGRSRRARIRDELRELADAASGSWAYDRIELKFPGTFLPRDLLLLDTPGVNSTSDFAVERTWLTLRADADACIVLSDLQQPMSASTQEFVATVASIVPYLVLVLTRGDRAVGAPEELAEALAVAGRRFAEAMGRVAEPGAGRPPSGPKPLITAAEPALNAMIRRSAAMAGEPDPQEEPARPPGAARAELDAFGSAIGELFDTLIRDRVLAQESRLARQLLHVEHELRGSLAEASRAAAARGREALARLPESPDRAEAAVRADRIGRLGRMLDPAVTDAVVLVDEGVDALERCWNTEIGELSGAEDTLRWTESRDGRLRAAASELRCASLALLSGRVGDFLAQGEAELAARLRLPDGHAAASPPTLSGALVVCRNPPVTLPTPLTSANVGVAVVEGVLDALSSLWVTPERRRKRTRELSEPLIAALRHDLRAELLGRSASLRGDVRRLMDARLSALRALNEPIVRAAAERLASEAAAAAGAAEAIDAARRELAAASKALEEALHDAAGACVHLARPGTGRPSSAR